MHVISVVLLFFPSMKHFVMCLVRKRMKRRRKRVASLTAPPPMRMKKSMPGQAHRGLKSPWRTSRWSTQSLCGSQWRSQENPNQRSPGGLRVSCCRTLKITSTLREARHTACTCRKRSLRMKESTCAKPSTAEELPLAPAFSRLKVSRPPSPLTTCMLSFLMVSLTSNRLHAPLPLGSSSSC